MAEQCYLIDDIADINKNTRMMATFMGERTMDEIKKCKKSSDEYGDLTKK